METTTTGRVESKPYLYEEVLPPGMLQDVASFGAGPLPGQPVPDFDLLTTDGKRVRRDDLAGSRPFLITFASLTCPMTAAAAAPLKRLYDRYAADADFLSVYVREAHPGDRIPQARDRDEKLTFAHRYQQRDRIPWPVAVDSLDGSFHRAMGQHPNCCYIVDAAGKVAFRALWSSDEKAIGEALAMVAAGQAPAPAESRRTALPALAGLGCMSETLESAGPQAQSQALRKTGPLYGLGKLAGLFSPLPPAARGAAALTVTAGAVAGVIALLEVVARGGRRRRQRP